MSSSLDALSERWPHLSQTFRRHWQTPLPEYARLLWADPPAGTVDPLLAAALRAESVRVTGSEDAAEVVLRRRVAPTAHHVTPTNGPGFLAADWIATAADDQPVTVLAWSGVSLSNTAWSGCLSFTTDRLLRPGSATAARAARARVDRSRDAGHTEERLWLFPSKHRNALLYRIPCHPRLGEVLADLTPELRARLPMPQGDEDFPTWALRACAAVQQAVVGKPLQYLDLCRVLADYLAAALEDGAHPLAALVRSPGAMAAHAPEVSWFYARRGQRVAVLRPDGDDFSGRGVVVRGGAVAEGLRDGTLCPGLLPGFVALACVNPIRCLGSFNQARYLSELRAAWGAGAREDGGPSLVAGRVAGEVYPLDRFVSGQPLPATAEIRMGAVWAGLLR